MAGTNPDDREFEHKNHRGDQVGVGKSLASISAKTNRLQPDFVARSVLAPVTIKIAKQSQEQEIFSSDKYQKSVSRGLTGELAVDDVDLEDSVDEVTSSWTAVSVMLDKRKKKMALLPATDEQTNRQVEVERVEVRPTSVDSVNQVVAIKPTETNVEEKVVSDLGTQIDLVDVDKLNQNQVEQSDVDKTTAPIFLPENDKVVVGTSRSTMLDFSRPSRRQFLLYLMPGGLRSSLVFKRQSSQQSKTKSSWKMLDRIQHEEASGMPVGMLKQVQHGRKKGRARGDGRRGNKKRKKNLSYWLSWLLIIGGVLIAITYVAPDLYFKLVPADIIKLGEVKGSQNDSATETQFTLTPTPTPYMPPIDPELPAGQWLIIPDIGVKTQPQATEDPEIALKNGVWIAPDYGQIGQAGMPIIMAAHRFGWKWWWQSDYWKLNSFYNLPETKEGTIVELIADQRKWTYLIYGGEEGDAITDYGADLILYTCKFLNSPIRHIRYARLIDPTRPELVLNHDNRPLSDEEKTELGKLFSLPY